MAVEALQPPLALGRGGPTPAKPSSKGHLLPVPLDTASADPSTVAMLGVLRTSTPTLPDQSVRGHQQLFPAGVPSTVSPQLRGPGLRSYLLTGRETEARGWRRAGPRLRKVCISHEDKHRLINLGLEITGM